LYVKNDAESTSNLTSKPVYNKLGIKSKSSEHFKAIEHFLNEAKNKDSVAIESKETKDKLKNRNDAFELNIPNKIDDSIKSRTV